MLVAMLGPQDLLLALILVFFFFGAKRLPEIAGSLGKSMKEFKKAVEGGHEAEAEAAKPTPELPPAAPAPRTCPSCQAPLEPDWQHCPKCGSAAPPPPATAPTP